MPFFSRAGSEEPLDAALPSWLGLNADRRGIAGNTDKPSFTVSDAAAHLTRAGLSWGALGEGAVVSFAFRATSGPLPLDVSGFARFTAAQIQATLLALQAWSDVAGITFVRQDDGGGYSNNATILFGSYWDGADGAAAFATLPGSTAFNAVAGDVWVNGSLAYNLAPAMGGYGQLTLVHEIGHAIGLLHPGDYNADPGVEITYGANASYYEDSNQYTVMSYFGEGATGAHYGAGRYVSAPMLDDIAAAQRLYGANHQTRTGDTVYGFNSTADRPWFSAVAGGAVPVFAVWDAGGSDTLDFSGYSVAQLIDLRQGAFSNVGGLGGNVSIAIGAVIENAIGGAGDDQFYGNSADNRFVAGGGHNRVDGGLGADTVVFSGARSAYQLTWDGPDLFVSGTEGSVRVRNVERLAFSDVTIEVIPQGGLVVQGDVTDEIAYGSAFADSISGSDGNDRIFGLDGHDQLVGGRGDDLVDGGAGNDIIHVDVGDDTLVGGEGIDTLDLESASGVTVNLETGVLTGRASGTDVISGFERIIGSRMNDDLTGDSADNYIQGFGGLDVIRGGGGDDELVGSWMEMGGADDVLKAQSHANASIATAVSLDQAFDRLPREGTYGFGQPHATVVATTHGGYEYYAFTMAGRNTDVNFDVDGASFDTVIRVFNASGVELARNDDATYNGDGGSPGDSYLNFRFGAPGVYYLQIGAYSGGTGATVQSTPPPAGQTYTLHVTVPDHATQPTYAQGSELFGDDGNDILRGTEGRDVLDGGRGDDIIYATRESDVIRGGDGWDTLHLIWDSSLQSRLLMMSEGEYLLKGPDGADRISGIEIIRFGNGVTIDLARMYSLGAFGNQSEGLLLSELAGRPWDLDGPLVLPGAMDPESPDRGKHLDPQILPGEASAPSADPYLDLSGLPQVLPTRLPLPNEETGLSAVDRLFNRQPWADADLLDFGVIVSFASERAWDWLD